MFLDASVIVALLAEEPGWEELQVRLHREVGPKYVSALARFEASQAIARLRSKGQRPTTDRVLSAGKAVDELLDQLDVQNVDLTLAIGELALQASASFGKVIKHPADLNMGDCFAYACAKSLGVPLLYKGNDFAQTDLA